MKKLSDHALAMAKLFVGGPPFVLTYKTPSRIPPQTRAALDELHDAKVVQRIGIVNNNVGREDGVEYHALARARTVGRIMSDTRAAKIKLPMTVD